MWSSGSNFLKRIYDHDKLTLLNIVFRILFLLKSRSSNPDQLFPSQRLEFHHISNNKLNIIFHLQFLNQLRSQVRFNASENLFMVLILYIWQ